MRPNEPPRIQLERESAERQRLVDLAFQVAPPPPAGMKRLMWFGNSDTPMPVNVPEHVAEQIAALSERAGLNKGPIRGFPMPEQLKTMRKIQRLVQPYIDAQYPTLPREGKIDRSASWWKRILRKCGLHT